MSSGALTWLGGKSQLDAAYMLAASNLACNGESQGMTKIRTPHHAKETRPNPLPDADCETRLDYRLGQHLVYGW